MVKLNKIYTRTGDGGSPGWSTARAIPKEHPHEPAIGDVDEANSAIGVALLHFGATKRPDRC